MHVSWKRLLITLGIIIVSSSLLGFLTWFEMDKIIQEKDAQINLLTDTSNNLSQLYLKKLAEKKAEEEAKASTKTTPKATQEAEETSSSSESSNETETQEEEPAPQSQIYFFYSPSCGACLMQKPIVLELQSEGIPFIFFDVVANPSYISQYGITAVPTFILNGHRITAVLSKEELLDFWNNYK